MTTFNFIHRLFGNGNDSSNKKTKRQRGRVCRIEELESREMLSVTPWSLIDDYGNICETSPVIEEQKPIQTTDASTPLAPLAAAPVNANARDLAVYNDLIARGCKDTDIIWNGTRIESIQPSVRIGVEMDFSGLTALKKLDCSGSAIMTLNLSGCISLETLDCSMNYLFALDVTGLTSLRTLDCFGNKLTTLNVSGLTNLTLLTCSSNQLTTLNVSGLTRLSYLNCKNNPLTMLVVSNTSLSSLDVSNTTTLDALYCSGSSLRSLNVSGCSTLQVLNCSNNTLTFSTLPSVGYSFYTYAPQQLVSISIATGNIVDLSSEYLGGNTTFTWYYPGGAPVDSSHYTMDSGVFTFCGLRNGDVIYCQMANSSFPDLILKTTSVTITCITFPSNFRSTSTTETSVALAWNAVAGATNYDIQYRQIGAEAWTTLTAVTGTTRTVSSLTAGTKYEFQIRASNSTEKSEWSLPMLLVATVLATPTGITATGKNATTLTVGWNAVSNASGYTIQSATNSNFSSNLKTQTVAGTETTADIINLTTGGLYFVRVMATTTDVYPDSAYSSIIVTGTPIAIPSNFRSTSPTETSVALAWDAVTGAIYYDIQYRQIGASDWTIMTVSGTSKTITSLTTGAEYEFQICARNSWGDSAWSSSVTITVGKITITNVTASTNTPQVGTQITTTLNPSGATAAYQWQRLVSGTWQNITTNGTSSSYTVVTADVGYALRVVVTGTGNYTGTATSDSTNAVPKIILSAPMLNSIFGITAGETLNVSWTASSNANTNTRYTVQWKLTNATGSTYSTAGVTVANSGAGTTATITGLVAGNYTVRLVATDSTATMDSSAPVTGTATVAKITLDTPKNIAATKQGDNTVVITWNAGTNHIAGTTEHTVEYQKNGTGSWIAVTNVNNTNRTATTTILDAGSYVFRVTATETGKTSSQPVNSNTVVIDQIPTQHTSPILNPPTKTDETVARNDGTVTITWAKVSGATAYKVQLQSNVGGTWTNVSGKSATLGDVATWTASGLAPGQYRVTVIASGGSLTDSTAAESSAVTVSAHVPVAPTVPIISVQPQSASYTQGQTATALSVTASGNGTLTYQWFRSGSSTVLATTKTYTPSTSTIGTESYYCIVTNTLNGSSKTAQSNTATITVTTSGNLPTAPTITKFTAYTVTLTWNKVQGSNIRYEVQFREVGETEWHAARKTATTSTKMRLSPEINRQVLLV